MLDEHHLHNSGGQHTSVIRDIATMFKTNDCDKQKKK